LELIAAGDLDAAEPLLNRRKAVLHNFRVIDVRVARIGLLFAVRAFARERVEIVGVLRLGAAFFHVQVAAVVLKSILDFISEI